jgi:hypothetical protein
MTTLDLRENADGRLELDGEPPALIYLTEELLRRASHPQIQVKGLDVHLDLDGGALHYRALGLSKRRLTTWIAELMPAKKAGQ